MKHNTGIVIVQFNKKKTFAFIFLAAIATAVSLTYDVSIFVMVLADALFILAANVRIIIPEGRLFRFSVTVSLLNAAAVFYFSRLMLNTDLSYLNIKEFLLNILICFCILIIFTLITGSIRLGNAMGIVFLMIFTTADYVVYTFRGNEITPYDLISLTTAGNVSGEYHFSPDNGFVIAWIFAILLLMLLTDFDCDRIGRREGIIKYSRIVVPGIIVLLLLSSPMNSIRWDKMGSMYNGVYHNFFLEIKECRIQKPAGYAEALKGDLAKYDEKKVEADDYPTIIVIMNESFADLQQLDSHFKTSIPVMPFFDSLDENTVKGYAYTSVIGGGTSSAEFEFLTGNTMAFLPQGSVPYQQFVSEDTYSLVSVMNELGYKTEGMHPFYSNGWNRDKVYKMLGFDEMLFIESFSNANTIRSFVSDKEMYKKIIKQVDKNKSGKPMFIFGVTMQNHGGYYDENYDSFISIKGHEGEFPEAEQYLSLINQSDTALEYLIDHFRNKEEHIIIVLFGDHIPALSDEFYDFATGEKSEEDDRDLSQRMKKYKIPFVIWGNYDIESERVDKTSLNYLSNYVLATAGIHTSFNSALKEIEKEIPAINSQGYYSTADGDFKRIKEAASNERDAIELYARIQYNELFDKKHKLKMFERQ